MPPAQACALATHSIDEPMNLWIGARRMPASAPLASKLGRFFSNLSCGLLSGAKVQDSQSGMRVYPLPSAKAIRCAGKRYCYEVEVLVRGVWAGWALRHQTVDVYYPVNRITHFRFFRDNLQHAWTFGRLLLRNVSLGPIKNSMASAGISALIWAQMQARLA